MSTPSDGNPWAQPGGPGTPSGPSGPPPAGPPPTYPSPAGPPPAEPSPAPEGPARSGYGTPSSPSYGKYGQGTALPLPAPAAPTGPQWGQPGYNAPPQQQWAQVGGPTEVKPIGGMRNLLILLSALTGVGLVVAGAMAPNQHQVFKDAFNGVTTAQAGSSGYDALSSVALLLELCVWVVTCVWLTRTRQNAMVMAPRQPRRSEAWIWLGWIIPVVNFWFPKQIVDDVIAATAQATGKPRIGTGFWWTAWLSSTALGVVLAVASLFPPNDTLHTALVVVDAVVVAVALLLWVRIVHWLSVSQDEAQEPKPSMVSLGQ